MGIVLDSTVLIAAERAGQNPRGVIEDLLRKMGDTEATLSIVTVIELAHGIERANSTARQIARGRFLNELLNEISVEPVPYRSRSAPARSMAACKRRDSRLRSAIC